VAALKNNGFLDVLTVYVLSIGGLSEQGALWGVLTPSAAIRGINP
jgi:hypothetical protein